MGEKNDKFEAQRLRSVAFVCSLVACRLEEGHTLKKSLADVRQALHGVSAGSELPGELLSILAEIGNPGPPAGTSTELIASLFRGQGEEFAREADNLDPPGTISN
jgi:hypothetical protein